MTIFFIISDPLVVVIHEKGENYNLKPIKRLYLNQQLTESTLSFRGVKLCNKLPYTLQNIVFLKEFITKLPQYFIKG